MTSQFQTQGPSLSPLFDRLAHCRKWIEDALAYGDDNHSFDNIAGGVLSGRYRLWVRPNGCAVTEIITYPRKRVCNVFLAGGEMQTIKDLQAPCEEYARANGCSSLVLTGRKGWVRALKDYGWNEVHTSLERKLT